MVDVEAEQRVRSTRAEIGRLGLELRAVQRAAADAERAVSIDVAPAPRAVLESELRDRIERRRREQAAELEEARAAAVALLASARTDAASLVSAASAETAGLLLGGIVPSRAAVPSGWATIQAAAVAAPIATAGWTTAAPVAPAPARDAARRGFWTDVAKADVLLPLVAVALVLLVLLAWVA